MRILTVCGALRGLGGVEEIVDNLCGEFAAAGHKVAVLSSPDVPEYLIGRERAPRPGIECFFTKLPAYRRPSWRHPERILWPLRDKQNLVERLRAWHPDIVNSHGICFRFSAIPHICRTLGVPFVQSLYTPIADNDVGWDLESFDILKYATAITALSDFTRRSFEPFLPASRDVHVIITGVDSKAAAAAAPLCRERPYIFCVARLDLRHKAIDVLVAAFVMIAAQYPELDLLIAGEGPDREQIAGIAASAGLEQRVHLLGFAPRDKLWSLHKGALMFAMPSRKPEGLGLVFLEAMACGTPVIATDSGGAPEIVAQGKTGLLISRNEPEELASAIRALMDNPRLRMEMGARGQERAAQCSWSRGAERYLEIYDSALPSKSSRRWPLSRGVA